MRRLWGWLRRRHELAAVLRQQVAAHGRAQARLAAETLIREKPESIETSPALVFELSESDYAPYQTFDRHRFQRHAFGLVGAMNGAERECATKIDGHPRVKRWVRNLERETQGGHWLPKSPGRFFPDFIVEMTNGTILLVEYKMGKLASDDEELHKMAVGELWAARSHGWCHFAWIVDEDWPELEKALDFR